MVLANPKTFPGAKAVEGGGRSSRRYPDGRLARGKKEWEEAGKQWNEKKARDEKKHHTDNMNQKHPEGLAEKRFPDGAVSRPRGSKPWND